MTSTGHAQRHYRRDIMRVYRLLSKEFGPQHWWPGDTAFEVMVGALLTQNTNWRNAARAIENLKQRSLLDPKKMLKNKTSLAKLIRPAGYYNVKSRRLLVFLSYFVAAFDGKAERMAKRPAGLLRGELLDLPGIGPETADSMLLYALGHPVFVVDAYTRRIFSRHGFFDDTLSYDEIRGIFEANLPRRTEIYNEYHALIVKLGKEFCKKSEPLCDSCPLRVIGNKS